MIKKWQQIASKALGDFRIFNMRQDTSVSPRTGQRHDFFVIESNDWVNIIPITAAGKVVMVRQFRHGNKAITLEIPGGLVDDGEDPQLAAEREMLEETGYSSDQVIPIGSVAPNPAIFDNVCHSYLALNSRKVSEPQFDGSEDIAVELIDLKKISDLITSGEITHALPIAAFYFFEQYLKKEAA